VGQKAPLKPKDVWAIRIHLQNAHHVRDLALFNRAIDSNLRGCDLVCIRVRDVTHGSQAWCAWNVNPYAPRTDQLGLNPAYSTVTDFAKFLGLSTSVPFTSAAWYDSSCSGITCNTGDSRP